MTRAYAEHDDGGSSTAALAWLTAQDIAFAEPLADVLTGLYTDGYLIGLISADSAMTGAEPGELGWTPGNTDEAETIIGTRGATTGLTALRETAQATARGIVATLLGRLARILATGTARGDSAETIGEALLVAVADPSRADAIAVTEVARGSGAGAQGLYQQRGVLMGEWVIDPAGEVCTACLDNAAAGQMPVGDPYPSGDAYAPAHPRCRCAVLPA